MRSLILNVVGQVDAVPVRSTDLATKFTKSTSRRDLTRLWSYNIELMVRTAIKSMIREMVIKGPHAILLCIGFQFSIGNIFM